MTRTHQQELDEEVRNDHDQTSIASVVRRTVRGIDAAATAAPGTTSPTVATGHSPFPAGTVGVANAVNGGLSTREGIASMRAAAEREREAAEHHDEQGVQNAREDQVNGGANTARGVAGTGQGVAQVTQALLRRAGAAAPLVTGAGTAATHFSRGAGVLQAGQGVFQLQRGIRNWNRPGQGNRAAQQVSDGILNTTAGGLALSANPLAVAGSTGIALGTVMREGADNYARESGVLGASHTSQRGYHPGGPSGAQNMTATDSAVELGMDVRARLGNGIGGSIAGGATTLAAAPAAVGATLLHGGITAASRNVGSSPDDIIAADQEERHAPLAANDHSRVAAHRRAIQRRHAQEAAAQEEATRQHHAQVAAERRPEMMQPERAPISAPFTPIAADNAQAIERRALGMPPAYDREAFERAVVENSR